MAMGNLASRNKSFKHSLKGKKHSLWRGALRDCIWPEGPHIYKIKRLLLFIMFRRWYGTFSCNKYCPK